MKNLYDVLVGPYLTEKGAALKENENKVLFKVSRHANKIEIKKDGAKRLPLLWP